MGDNVYHLVLTRSDVHCTGSRASREKIRARTVSDKPQLSNACFK